MTPYRAYADRMQCILRCDFFSSLFIISFSMVDYPIFVRTSPPSTILPVEVALCLTGYFRSVKCEHNSVKKGALTLFGWYFLSIPTTRWQHTYPVLAKRHPLDDLNNQFSTLIKMETTFVAFLQRLYYSVTHNQCCPFGWLWGRYAYWDPITLVVQYLVFTEPHGKLLSFLWASLQTTSWTTKVLGTNQRH